jgi:archaemetzincin
MAGLSPSLRAFFEDWTGFEPLGRRGETVPVFLGRRHNRPDRIRHTLVVVPLQGWPRGLSPQRLQTFLQAFFQMPVELGDGSYLRLPPRAGGKYSAEKIQAQLRRHLPDPAYSVLALADVDIYSEDDSPRSLLFGQGHYRDRTAVASLNRLHSPDPRLLHHRAFKLVAHELCHTFGMQHCGRFRCLMNPSSSLQTSDRRPLALCPICLRKLHSVLGFAPEKRYRDLLAAEQPALPGDQAWLRRRLRRPALTGRRTTEVAGSR